MVEPHLHSASWNRGTGAWQAVGRDEFHIHLPDLPAGSHNPSGSRGVLGGGEVESENTSCTVRVAPSHEVDGHPFELIGRVPSIITEP